jgi:thiol-disulfide isomerase/thioredoxin
MQGDPGVQRELLYECELVKVNVGHFDKQMDLPKNYGAEVGKYGLPYLTLLDADGKVLANRESRAFETKEDAEHTPENPAYDLDRLLAFLKQHEAPRLVADDVLRRALTRAASEDKRVFLHFGAPWCGWCHRLEDWLARPEIAAIVGKEFVDCKIDTERMIGGADSLKIYAGEKTGIPWFVMLDKSAERLADSNGPGGNIGFPSKDDEIAHFAGMLRKACAKLSPDDIKTLQRSLITVREADKN